VAVRVSEPLTTASRRGRRQCRDEPYELKPARSGEDEHRQQSGRPDDAARDDKEELHARGACLGFFLLVEDLVDVDDRRLLVHGHPGRLTEDYERDTHLEEQLLLDRERRAARIELDRIIAMSRIYRGM